jgi:hypothetical protein
LIRQAASQAEGGLATINLVTEPVQNVTRADVTGYSAYAAPVTYYEYLRPRR